MYVLNLLYVLNLRAHALTNHVLNLRECFESNRVSTPLYDQIPFAELTRSVSPLYVNELVF